MGQTKRGRRLAHLAVKAWVGAWAVAVLACGGPSSPPDDVARDFWEAVRVRDLDAAADDVTLASAHLLTSDDTPASIDQVLVGEVLSNERSAIVRTSMSTHDDGVDLNIVFNTHLALEDDRWKVDLEATREEVTRATFAAGMQMVGEAINQGVQEFGEALERGADEVKEAIRDAIDDLESGDRL